MRKTAGRPLWPYSPSRALSLLQLIWLIGYARLSIFETRDRADSEALQNQKELLRQYIANAPDLQARWHF